MGIFRLKIREGNNHTTKIAATEGGSSLFPSLSGTDLERMFRMRYSEGREGRRRYPLFSAEL